MRQSDSTHGETAHDSTSHGHAAQRQLRPTIGLGHAVALYVGAVLGAGVLVLPGQAASLAGPASLMSWAFVGLLGVPVALTFAALAVRHPDAGGVATFVSRAFGSTAGGVTGWLYFVAGSLGQTIVPLTGGYYVATVFDAGDSFAIAVAIGILAVAVVANLFGIRLSGRLQLGLAAGVGVILLAATVAALPHIDPANFTPFAPHGLAGIGQAAVVLFFAFAGWETVTHLASEFRNVKRDLRRATLITAVIVVTLYLGVSLAVVGTGSYGNPTLNRIAVGAVLEQAFGIGAVAGAGLLAVLICLGTTNTFIASVSRLGYALGRDGWLPTRASRINAREVPHVSILAVGAIGLIGLIVALLAELGTEDLVALASSLVLATYLVGTAAGTRLLAGRERVIAWLACGPCLLITPFAGAYMIVPLIVAATALVYRYVHIRRTRRGA